MKIIIIKIMVKNSLSLVNFEIIKIPNKINLSGDLNFLERGMYNKIKEST